MYSIAADFPGLLLIDLYCEDELFYTSNVFGVGGVGNFGGLVSFDRAVLSDPPGQVFLDDLHFGPPIPAPSALCIVGAALLASRRWRA